MPSTGIRRAAAVAAACAGVTAVAVAVAATTTVPSPTVVAARDGCTSGNCSDPTNSFVSATLVVMADGSRRPIGDIRAGDHVRAVDPATAAATTTTVHKPIVGQGRKDLVSLALATGGRLTATANHRCWVVNRGGWTAAGDLTIDDVLLDEAGRPVPVKGVAAETRQTTVYNLDVDGAGTYVVEAGGRTVVVHE